MKKILFVLFLTLLTILNTYAKETKFSKQDIKCTLEIEKKIFYYKNSSQKSLGIIGDVRLALLQAYLTRGYSPCEILKFFEELDKNIDWKHYRVVW